MKINYVTTNKFKFTIAEHFFINDAEHELVQRVMETPEIQAETCEEVATFSAIYAAKEIGEPCVVMDIGFFIPALNGFPGPFLKYTNKWLSEERLLKMLDETDDRSAYFIDVLAVGFPNGESKLFSRKTDGSLAKAGEYTPSHWPANSLFIPDGHSIPLGSMSDAEQADFWRQSDENWAKLLAFLNNQPAVS